MKVVILCGGQGTRLREQTEYMPKPLVPVGDKPILWHIMKLYAHHGFHDFVLCLGYRGQMIKDYFLNYEAMNNDFTVHLGRKREIIFHNDHPEQGFRVTLAETGAETMTGARIRKIERYIDSETFMVTYGDGVSDVNIRNLTQFHQQHNKLATVTAIQPVSRYGAIRVDEDQRVTEFIEKPKMKDWVNAGFFVFNYGIFNYLSPDEDCILEQEPVQRLAKDSQLTAYHHDGFFFAMDTYREYLYLNKLWNSGKAPWAVWNESHAEQPLV
jgi:glucose-1-phosphate cytidylyltransferase